MKLITMIELLENGIKTDNLRKDTVNRIKGETDNSEIKELLEEISTTRSIDSCC